MSAAAIKITPAQRVSIETSLQDYAPHIVSRGAALMRERAVRSMTPIPGGLVAQVQGSRIYQITLSWTEKEAVIGCSCPMGKHCKHAVALLLELRKNAVPVSLPKKPTNLASPSPSAAPSLSTLAGQVIAKLGRPLPTEARQTLQAVEPWWTNKISKVEQASLLQSCGRSAWGYQKVTLWPAEIPPADLWEFLACLAIALKKLNAQLPDPLPSLLDPGLQKELTAKWQRHHAVQEWKTFMGQWQDPDLDETEAGPELRLVLHYAGATIQARQPNEAEFGKISQKALKDLSRSPLYGDPPPKINAGSSLVLKAFQDSYGKFVGNELAPLAESLNRCLTQLISNPELLREHVVSEDGEPLQLAEKPLKWSLKAPTAPGGDYHLHLYTDDGQRPEPPVAIIPGNPVRYVTSSLIYPLSYWPFKNERQTWPTVIPAAALESREGVNALAKLGVEVPARLAEKVQTVKASMEVRGEVHRYSHSPSDYFRLEASAKFEDVEVPSTWNGSRWIPKYWDSKNIHPTEDKLVQIDKSRLPATAAWLRQMPLRQSAAAPEKVEQRIVGKDWPDLFAAWIARRPEDITVTLDAELASLRDGGISGQVRLEIEESKSGMDWFDLTVALDVTDHTLSQDEINLLLRAKGKWVKLPGKGWRKLEFNLTDQQEQDLADLGLSAQQFTGEKQRLHALQLDSLTKSSGSLLPADSATQVRRRLEEIHTRVTPAQPAVISATLRPYQTEGFHFLAYLSTNGFGGVLADDMGLGKTLQALTWIAWLRAEQKVQEPILVICPKSVQDNWRAEAARFSPDLRVTVWNRGNSGKEGLDGSADLLVIHYPHLRQHEELLREQKWGAVILDEAQAIKNPTSQSARAACALEARHRLALTGTPIENRLLDLWSIFAFAMPGILGSRASFGRVFDANEDPLARRRLAARTKPFLLRRTKKEVATDLPERVEEDLLTEMEGTQATLYQAEIKRSRAQLLKVETSHQLDKVRFNILTSLLRLRQICCHPRLVGLDKEATPAKGKKKKAAEDESESAKLNALIEQLEPIMEEGQKVLVFSQFVQMLEIIQDETAKQNWTTFILTGDTEDRGALVSAFQSHEGPAVFLISLKAGGSGLNLTAASYVVLYDPWWNPAVEAQAIDRTHRIGQKQTVFAYRLIMKDTIEEKIRMLQKQKGALAQDILGEESFAQGLTLNDFQFLLG